MTHQYKKLPVTMKMWIQFNVMPRMTVQRGRRDTLQDVMASKIEGTQNSK